MSAESQQLSSRHVIAATDTTDELWESVFSVRSVPRLYNEANCYYESVGSLKSLETAIRRLGGWCEMVASLRGGPEPGSKGSSIAGKRYQAAQ
jgi:hypothetical protein